MAQSQRHLLPRVRVSGMCWHDDQLLLIRQGNPDSPRWMLPGGGVEPGEDLERALARELAEEVGLDNCNAVQPVALAESIAPPKARSRRHLIHVIFHVECPGSLGQVSTIDPDVHEARWFERTEITGLPLHPPIAGYLSQWQPGQAFAYLGSLWAP